MALALINAESASLPPSIIAELGHSIETMENMVKAAERFRLRQLRKVDQLEQSHG